jgi:hypothetical protein
MFGGQSDALSVGQAQQSGVVEHRVHVLDPQRVDRAVEADPLLLAVGGVGGLADVEAGDAVGPVLGQRVLLPVQLAHGDRLGVDGDAADRGELLGATEGSAEAARALMAFWRVPMRVVLPLRAWPTTMVPNRTLRVELSWSSFWLKAGTIDQARCRSRYLVDLPVQQAGWTAIADPHGGEQVVEQRVEQGHVVLEELGQVGVPQGLDEQHVLVLVRALSA